MDGKDWTQKKPELRAYPNDQLKPVSDRARLGRRPASADIRIGAKDQSSNPPFVVGRSSFVRQRNHTTILRSGHIGVSGHAGL